MNTTETPWSTRNKVGLGMAIFYNVTNIPSFLASGDEGETGPPLAIMIICSILGVVGLVAGIVAWRQRSRPAARLTAASIIVETVTSLPAFFVDVPAFVKALVALSVVITVAAVVLMFSSATRPASARAEMPS